MHPVIQAILDRAKVGSRPGHRLDGHKIGLAIEGGSMRGTISVGMVTGLEYLGMLDCFDAVYGSSAGAINGAFFVAQQAAYGATIYYQNINNRRFLNLWRGLVGRPVMSLEFLIDHVMQHDKVLD